MELYRTKSTITKTVKNGKNKKTVKKTFCYETVKARAESDEDSELMKDVTEYSKTDPDKGGAVDLKGLDSAGNVNELMTPSARAKARLHGGQVMCLGNKKATPTTKEERMQRMRAFLEAKKEAEELKAKAKAAQAKAHALQAEAEAEDSKIDLFGSDEEE